MKNFSPSLKRRQIISIVFLIVSTIGLIIGGYLVLRPPGEQESRSSASDLPSATLSYSTNEGVERLDVSLPETSMGESPHWGNVMVYDAVTGTSLGKLSEYHQSSGSGGNTYFPGNSTWPNSYWRYHGTQDEFRERGLPYEVQVMFVGSDGVAYSKMSNIIKLGEPPMTPTLVYATDQSERIDVSLPETGMGENPHREAIKVFDAETGDQLGDLIDFHENVAGLSNYFAGSPTFPNSYWRFYGTGGDFRTRGLPQKIQVMFIASNGASYSTMSNVLTLPECTAATELEDCGLDKVCSSTGTCVSESAEQDLTVSDLTYSVDGMTVTFLVNIDDDVVDYTTYDWRVSIDSEGSNLFESTYPTFVEVPSEYFVTFETEGQYPVTLTAQRIKTLDSSVSAEDYKSVTVVIGDLVCSVDSDCDDDNACTTDSCGTSGECQYVPLVCDAGLVCDVNSGLCVLAGGVDVQIQLNFLRPDEEEDWTGGIAKVEIINADTNETVIAWSDNVTVNIDENGLSSVLNVSEGILEGQSFYVKISLLGYFTSSANIASAKIDEVNLATIHVIKSGGSGLIGDLSGVGGQPDGVISSADFRYIAIRYFTDDETADLNKDGVVNSLDMNYLAQHLGETVD